MAVQSFTIKGPTNVVSFFKDEELASKLHSMAAKEKLYCEIASTAESGWDFSSRWMRFGCLLSLKRNWRANSSAAFALVITSTAIEDTKLPDPYEFIFAPCTTHRLFLTSITVLFRNSTDMTTLATTYIIPVDLNTFLFKVRCGACHGTWNLT